MYSLGAFPAIVRGRGSIEVEVYVIDEYTLKRLDSLEGYSGYPSIYNMYNREKVQTQYGVAFIYVWADNRVDTYTKVSDGVWKQKPKPTSVFWH